MLFGDNVFMRLLITLSFLYSITISFGGYSMFWITQFSDGCFNSWIDEMSV